LFSAASLQQADSDVISVSSYCLTSNLKLALTPNKLIDDNASVILEQAVAHLRDRFY
jgi:hypothetical protein